MKVGRYVCRYAGIEPGAKEGTLVLIQVHLS